MFYFALSFFSGGESRFPKSKNQRREELGLLTSPSSQLKAALSLAYAPKLDEVTSCCRASVPDIAGSDKLQKVSYLDFLVFQMCSRQSADVRPGSAVVVSVYVRFYARSSYIRCVYRQDLYPVGRDLQRQRKLSGVQQRTS